MSHRITCNSIMCKHGLNPTTCVDCVLQSTCVHNLRIKYCLPCRNEISCTHKEHRKDCKLCRPIYCSVCDVVSAEIYHKTSTLHRKNSMK